MANVGSVPLGRRELFKEIRTVGKVELNELRTVDITARMSGPIEHVFADAPGAVVAKGDPLTSILSTEVLIAQQQFIIAFRHGQSWGQKSLIEQGWNLKGMPTQNPLLNSFFRLQLWGMTQKELEELSRSETAQAYFTVRSPINGTILERKARRGQYVREGDVLYVIADLSRVWLTLDAYESDLGWIRLGQPAEVTLESDPQRPATGKVGLIEPIVNDATRSLRVRVMVENPDGHFKPGMYAQARLRVPVGPDGGPASTGLEGKFTCAMHPYVVVDKPGECEICKMALTEVPKKADVPMHAASGHNPSMQQGVLALPAEAVLSTGRRQLVYVELEPGKYRVVEPKLGPRAGDYYPVLAGLEAGQRVVTRGTFLLDSAFQISGRTSLLSSDAPPPNDGLTAKQREAFAKLSDEDRALATAQRVCPISGLALGGMGAPYKMEVNGRTLFLCCKGCEKAVLKDPDAALRKLEAAKQGAPH
jgi:Cu(I)/Ag(I) efflux system membrane fusion protein